MFIDISVHLRDKTIFWEFCTCIWYVLIKSTPYSLHSNFSSTPLFSCNFMCSLFWNPLRTLSGCAQMLDHLLEHQQPSGVTSLKKTYFPSLSSHQLQILSQLLGGAPWGLLTSMLGLGPLALAQALCMQSQWPCVHMCNSPVMSSK